MKRSGLVKNKDKARTATAEGELNDMGAAKSKEQSGSKTQATSEEKTPGKDYNISQLAATFSTRDWEELYAFVEEIDSMDKGAVSYEAAWESWAEKEDNQTAEQWRQYYEKVVRPQWERDPASKRERIRKKVMERHKDDSSSPTKSQSWSQPQEAVVASQEVDSAPPKPSNPPQRTASNTMPSDSRLESESTAQQETPQYIRNGYDSALKRIRGEVEAAPKSTEASRPAKVRRKTSISSTPPEPAEAVEVDGTQEQPLEISSAVSSQQARVEQPLLEEAAQPQRQEQVAEVVDLGDEASSEISEDDHEQLAPLPRPTVSQAEEDNAFSDLESVASSTDFTHIAPLPRPPRIPEDPDSEDDDDLPSNTPTPRAHKFAAFDTQAILSPSQNFHHISRLPRPPLDSSPPHHPDSEASTTQSLQEFSSYVKDDEDAAMQREVPMTRAPRPASPTPSATSEVSSAGSGDPDAPLAADEMDGFFAEQHDAGFSDESITKALKRTRFRPGLALAVLDAWRSGRALPDQRGIWALEEDEMVESGDGAALAHLERKHTLDGWGGITERMNFLSAWSTR